MKTYQVSLLTVLVLVLVLAMLPSPADAQSATPVTYANTQSGVSQDADSSDESSQIDSSAEDEAAAEPLPLENFTFSGQVRHRSELDRRTSATPASLHLLRTRLNVQFTPTSDVEAFVQVQDARAFGSGNPAAGRGTLDGAAPSLDLHQAYFAVSGLFGVPLTLKVGRQELVYGNQRLVGSVGWSNVGRSFDAGVLRYQTSAVAVDAFAARLVDDRARDAAQNLIGLYSTWTLGTPKLDAFVLYDDDTAPIEAGPDAGAAALVRTTVGTRLFSTLGAADVELEGAYQFGEEARGAMERASIAAYLVSASAGVAVGKGRVGALYTILSGDDDPSDGEVTTFNTLFATNHKFYGYLDLFPFNAAFRPGGLRNAAIQTSYAATESILFGLDVHHFRLADDLGAGTALGQEADLSLRWRYNPAFAIVGGASAFVASERAEAILGTGTSTWFYLSTVVGF